MKKIEEMTRLSIFEVFKKMFFVFLEPLDDEGNGYDVEAAIRFEGPVSGEIRIFLSTDLVKTMVQNMLGLQEDEITMQSMEDCSKEAVNMICGNFLGRFDSTKVFNLSVPTFSKEIRSLELGKNAFRTDFDSDGGRVGMMATLSNQ
ncbi:MAG TPA: chemotaxis protein CheX [Anaerolineae bacterium]|nr:chemotaxis protein CheX [Anaerolineae bacterium]